MSTPSDVQYQTPVVGQSFGIFNYTTAQFQAIVNAAPFAMTNIIYVSFVHTYPNADRTGYVVGYENARNGQQPAPGDTDADRILYLAARARSLNPNIKILLSLGWGKLNDVGNAAKSPVIFAESVAEMVTALGVDGFDIDYESVYINGDDSEAEEALNTLVTQLRTALGADKLLTISPAQEEYLTADTLAIFDLVQPQTYISGGNGTVAEPYAALLAKAGFADDGYPTIVYGICSEYGDNPAINVGKCFKNKAAGVFAWRLDTDTVVNGFPTFAIAKLMWTLMHK